MPVRSIKLRLVVPRAQTELQAAKALWANHTLINEAVAYYERMLLLLRGEAYQVGDTTIMPEVIHHDLVRVMRTTHL